MKKLFSIALIIAGIASCTPLPAQTITPTDAVSTAPVGVGKALTDFIVAVATNADAGTSFAVSKDGAYGQEIGQSLALFGSTGTNYAWSVGLHHATFFTMGSWGKADSTGYTDMLGVKFRWGWKDAWWPLKLALFNANNISIDFGVDYPTTKWINGRMESGPVTPYFGLSRTFGP